MEDKIKMLNPRLKLKGYNKMEDKNVKMLISEIKLSLKKKAGKKNPKPSFFFKKQENPRKKQEKKTSQLYA